MTPPPSASPAPLRVLLTGGSGILGRFVAPALARAGHAVIHLARRAPATGALMGTPAFGPPPPAPFAAAHGPAAPSPAPMAGPTPGPSAPPAAPPRPESPLPASWLPWDLGAPPPDLPLADALVHLAFDHRPGAYRGGEGDDPDGFLARNRDGSLALFEAARAAGVRRIVFLSTRAVYGDARRGEVLRETDAPRPDSLYGAMKLEVERALLARPGGVALRATGVYGRAPGAASHKWSGLFADYLSGRPVASRAATEIHGDDLAAAVLLLLARPETGVFNASDLLVDQSGLLAGLQARTGCPHPPPPPAGGPAPGRMATDRLQALGWRPGGEARLKAFLDVEASC